MVVVSRDADFIYRDGSIPDNWYQIKMRLTGIDCAISASPVRLSDIQTLDFPRRTQDPNTRRPLTAYSWFMYFTRVACWSLLLPY